MVSGLGRVEASHMTEPYQPKYVWKRTQIDANDPPTDYDWIGYDGVGAVRRIRKEMQGPTKGKWQWAGWYPRDFKGSPPTPTTGWVDTARIATQMCEEYWDRARPGNPTDRVYYCVKPRICGANGVVAQMQQRKFGRNRIHLLR